MGSPLSQESLSFASLEQLGSPVPEGLKKATKKVNNKSPDGPEPKDLGMLRIEGLKDEVVVESELEIGKDDYTISTEGNYPEITFFERIQEWIDRSLGKTVLVRLFGKKKYWLQSFGRLSTSFMGFNLEIPGEYEGLPVICYECGCYGHTKKSCPKQQENEKKVGLTELTVVPTIDTVTATIVGSTKDSISLYRPWMQAPTYRRRPNILEKSIMKGKQDQPLVKEMNKSRFQILEDNEKESRRKILKGSNSEGLVKDSYEGKINGGSITKANGKESQSTLEKDQSNEVVVGEKLNHTTGIIDDNNILVGHSIASSSNDPMLAMKRVGTSMYEITKRGFKLWKKQGFAKSSGSLLSEWIESVTRQLDNLDNSDSNVIHAIQDLLHRDWDISIRHVYRERDRMTDYLAKTAEGMVISFYSWSQPPNFALNVFYED
ncbi:hypothetical protein Goshw_027874, partial [Gossypium schwendimanii]|nr:hypothetical protein [Gossypium schwendimanii]